MYDAPRSQTIDTQAEPPLAGHYDVVIVGAGLAGCALAQALSLADQGRRRKVLVVDLHRGCSPRFSGEFIHPRGAEVLDDLGFYGHLSAAGAVDVEGFVVLDGATGPRVDLDYDSVAGQRPHGIAVHHKTLVRTMRKVIRERDQVDLREGWRVTDLVREGARVSGVVLQSPSGRKHEIKSDLVVGADGKASTVRKLAGLPDGRKRVGFTAGIELEDSSNPSQFAASVIVGAPGPMLVYPIEWRGEKLISRITFDLPHELPVKRPGLADYLLRVYVPHLPAKLAREVAAGIIRDRDSLEMAPTIELPAPPATAPGIALIGDAAGCSHPITASGMTMGLLDAKLLGDQAQLRAEVPTGQPWLSARSLRRYRSEHDRYVPTRQALASAIYEAFCGEQLGARGIRRALFQYWSNSPANRRRSLALLACAEGRPTVFLSEYLRTAGHVVRSAVSPAHATHYPASDRLRQVQGALGLAGDKLGMFAKVSWAQVRPGWLAELG